MAVHFWFKCFRFCIVIVIQKKKKRKKEKNESRWRELVSRKFRAHFLIITVPLASRFLNLSLSPHTSTLSLNVTQKWLESAYSTFVAFELLFHDSARNSEVWLGFISYWLD